MRVHSARTSCRWVACLLAAGQAMGCGGSEGEGPADAQETDAATTGDGTVSDAPAPIDAGVEAAVVARRPFPQVPNTAGLTLSPPTLVTVIASNDVLADSLSAFSNAFPSSGVWAQTSAEYGLGTITSAAVLVIPAMTGTQTTGQLADYISAATGIDGGPPANGKTIYLIYLPDGATYAGAEGTEDCGYHAPYPNVGSSGDAPDPVELVK